MKTIGITGRLTQEQTTLEIRDCLDIQWHSYLRGLGFLVQHLLYSEDQVRDFLKDCAGVILSGGNSLGSVCDEPLSRMRDQFEIKVLGWALKNGVPVLGICRGAQLLWQFAGGQILQNQGHAGTRHSLDFVSGLSCQVESYHDFCLGGRQAHFVELAHGPDGLVEAFHGYNGKALGLMWHPERKVRDLGLRQHTDRLILEFFQGVWPA